jgi:hypothetical protein
MGFARRLALQALCLLFVQTSIPRAAELNLVAIRSDFAFIEAQARKTVASLAPGAYPRSQGDRGAWKTVGPDDWTSGFFPGELWLLYQATGSPEWRAAARAWTAPLASQAARKDTHDLGFMIGLSFGNAYRLTGDPNDKSILLTAAASLASRFNPKVGALRSWDFGPWRYPVIVDNMMNLGLLFWGARQGDPHWSAIATRHARSTLARLVRSDGCVRQLADFDPETGRLIGYDRTGGMTDNSVWSRGQAWALYGFAEAYQATGDPALGAAADKAAECFLRHLPPDGAPFWDFDAAALPTTPRDSSAAAIAADGLMILSDASDASAKRAQDLKEAEVILASLSAGWRAPAAGEAILAHGSASGRDPHDADADTALIWGDYYFAEALLRLRNRLEHRPGWSLYGNAFAPRHANPR